MVQPGWNQASSMGGKRFQVHMILVIRINGELHQDALELDIDQENEQAYCQATEQAYLQSIYREADGV